MKFRGVTNFKQLFLARHFSAPDHHGDAFLFLLGSYGLAAVPERSRLVTRNLPFGLPGDLADTEWRERVQRRISTLFRGRRVCLYTPEHSAELCRVLQEISGAEMIEATNWEEAVAEGTVYFLESGCRLIHPALPPPKEKDPKASGTYAACLFLLLTLLSLGFLIGRNALTRSILQRDIAESQKKIDTVKQEKEALQSLEKQLAGQQELFAVMKQKKRVSGHLLLVLNLLARYPLQYSRITAVEERSTGIHLQGESVWQPDLSRFFTHFEGELSKYQLTLFSEGLSKDKGGRILFRSRVAPAGGGKK